MENGVSLIVAEGKDDLESAKAYCTKHLEKIDDDTCIEIRDIRREVLRVYVSNFAHSKCITLKTKSTKSGLIIWKPRFDGEDYPQVVDPDTSHADFSAEFKADGGGKFTILPYPGEKIRAFVRRALLDASPYDQVLFIGCDAQTVRHAAYYVSSALDKPIQTKIVKGNMRVEIVKTTASRRFK